MRPPSKLILILAATCGLFAVGSASAYDYGYGYGYGSRYDSGCSSGHNHRSAYGGYGYRGGCYDRTVAWAQSVLKQLGYYCGCVDGIAGSQTARALVRYQCDHGLPHTGCLDSRTICALRDE